MSSLPLEISYLGEDDSEYFRCVHDRILNTLNPTYMLPADRDEAKVCFRPLYVLNSTHIPTAVRVAPSNGSVRAWQKLCRARKGGITIWPATQSSRSRDGWRILVRFIYGHFYCMSSGKLRMLIV